MSQVDRIVRAWKDEEYLLSLSEAERESIPQNPAGLVELSDSDLLGASGGMLTTSIITITIALCGPSLELPCPSMVTICPEL
jgi:mersacidin/lichenicidin family type 2 lantibiotic